METEYGNIRWLQPAKDYDAKPYEVVCGGNLPSAPRLEIMQKKVRLCCNQLPDFSRQGFVGLPLTEDGNKELYMEVMQCPEYKMKGYILCCEKCNKYLMDMNMNTLFQKWNKRG